MTVSRWKSGILVLVVSLLFLSTDIKMVSAGETMISFLFILAIV